MTPNRGTWRAYRRSSGVSLDPGSGRVYLRPPAARDRDEFLQLVHASRRFLTPWASPPADPEAFRAYLGRCRRKDFVGRLLCRAVDDCIVGVFNLSQIHLCNFRSAYLGYWVGSPFAGQGYMAEGMALLLREAFVKIGLHRVEANIQPLNDASIRLVRRCGFHLEGYSARYLKVRGRWRDHERWAITVETWRAGVKRTSRP